MPDNIWLAGVAMIIEDAGMPGSDYVDDNTDALLRLRAVGFAAWEVATVAIDKGPN